MMASAASELQRAVFAALTGDPELQDEMDGVRLHDHAPANVEFPYLAFGRTSVFDWSTGTEEGNEHLFTLHVWSKSKGKAEALRLMEIVRARLHGVAPALETHSLVNLRLEYEEVRFNEDLAVYHGMLRFRAVTEPA